MRSKTAGETDWELMIDNPITLQKTYAKWNGNNLIIRETIPAWLAQQMLDENKLRANSWTGWSGKSGAVVASIPNNIDQELKRASGYDPTKGGWYDKDKYNSLLDDSDYAYLRTGGGKIGKKKAQVAVNQQKLKKIIGVTP
jgi:hypothetical protein